MKHFAASDRLRSTGTTGHRSHNEREPLAGPRRPRNLKAQRKAAVRATVSALPKKIW